MINSLSAISCKKGPRYIDKLLEKELVITEKIDTFRLLFEQKNGQLLFFKKDNKPIDLIERTITDIWEDAILEIETLVNNTSLPEGITFGLYYTPVERPLRLPYTNIPKYILTDLTRRKDGKILESFNYEEVTHWAGMLCMGRPPVIFQGKLNEEQKKILIEYDTKQYSDSTLSFSEMINQTLGSYSKEDIIEGIIIQSGDDLAQVISYEFELLDEAYKKERSRDFYDVTMLSIGSFMESYSFPIVKNSSQDQMYIDIISDIFNRYCVENEMNETIDPTYLSPPVYGCSGKLNKKFITNETTKAYLSKSIIYEALFKVMLSSFRKYKKPYGLLTESFVEKFNGFVYLINDRIEKESKTLNESLNEIRSENLTVLDVNKRKASDIDNMRVIASIQRAFDAKNIEIAKGAQKCAVYVTTFEPFTNSQMKNIEQINKTMKIPVIIAAVSSEYKINGNAFHVSDRITSAQMKAISDFNTSLVPSWTLLKSLSLIEIFEFCRSKFEPIAIITDLNKRADLSLQLYFEEEIMGKKIGVEPTLQVTEMENEESLISLRTIEDNNALEFNNITPAPIHALYNSILSEYNAWSGAVPKIPMQKFTR